jgi:hypothetical protein
MPAPNIGARTEPAIRFRTGPWQRVPWAPVYLLPTRKTGLFRGFFARSPWRDGAAGTNADFRKILAGSISGSDDYSLGGIAEINFGILSENANGAGGSTGIDARTGTGSGSLVMNVDAYAHSFAQISSMSAPAKAKSASAAASEPDPAAAKSAALRYRPQRHWLGVALRFSRRNSISRP